MNQWCLSYHLKRTIVKYLGLSGDFKKEYLQALWLILLDNLSVTVL